jgi:hypothetical protein
MISKHLCSTLGNALIFVLFLLLPIFVGAAEAGDSGEPYMPTLYLDGEAMAADVGRWFNQIDPNVVISTKKNTINPQDLRLGRSIEPNSYYRQNEALTSWVLSQPDRSITPSVFIEKCIELTNFDVQGGFILAWNYLANGWAHPLQRNQYDESKKLIDITGEFAAFDGSYHYMPIPKPGGGFERNRRGVLTLQRVVTKRGDKRGAWYHMFGTALAAYSYSNTAIGNSAWLTNAMIWFEKTYYNKTAGVSNSKRINIDRAGAAFGFNVARRLSDKASTVRFDLKGLNEQSPVLTPRADIYDSKYVLAPGQRAWEVGTDLNRESAIYRSRDYLIAMLMAGQKDDLILHPARLFTSSEGNVFLQLLRDYRDSEQRSEQIEDLLRSTHLENKSYEENDLTITPYKIIPEVAKQIREGMNAFDKLKYEIATKIRGAVNDRVEKKKPTATAPTISITPRAAAQRCQALFQN